MVRALLGIVIFTCWNQFAIAERVVKTSLPYLPNAAVYITISNPSNVAQTIDLKLETRSYLFVSAYTSGTGDLNFGLQWTCSGAPVFTYGTGNGGYYSSCSVRDDLKTIPAGGNLSMYVILKNCTKTASAPNCPVSVIGQAASAGATLTVTASGNQGYLLGLIETDTPGSTSRQYPINSGRPF